MRIGIGYDIHRLEPSDKPCLLPLGGISIPSLLKVKAHSDGDVLLHALVDSCLGSLSLGDIGRWFPDSDPANRDRPSTEFLSHTLERIYRLGWRVTQMDSIIFLEEPKLSPYVDSIRTNVALLLKLDPSSVSLKAKTMEGLGPIGSSKAIAAQVVITMGEI